MQFIDAEAVQDDDEVGEDGEEADDIPTKADKAFIDDSEVQEDDDDGVHRRVDALAEQEEGIPVQPHGSKAKRPAKGKRKPAEAKAGKFKRLKRKADDKVAEKPKKRAKAAAAVSDDGDEIVGVSGKIPEPPKPKTARKADAPAAEPAAKKRRLQEEPKYAEPEVLSKEAEAALLEPYSTGAEEEEAPNADGDSDPQPLRDASAYHVNFIDKINAAAAGNLVASSKGKKDKAAPAAPRVLTPEEDAYLVIDKWPFALVTENVSLMQSMVKRILAIAGKSGGGAGSGAASGAASGGKGKKSSSNRVGRIIFTPDRIIFDRLESGGTYYGQYEVQSSLFGGLYYCPDAFSGSYDLHQLANHLKIFLDERNSRVVLKCDNTSFSTVVVTKGKELQREAPRQVDMDKVVSEIPDLVDYGEVVVHHRDLKRMHTLSLGNNQATIKMTVTAASGECRIECGNDCDILRDEVRIDGPNKLASVSTSVNHKTVLMCLNTLSDDPSLPITLKFAQGSHIHATQTIAEGQGVICLLPMAVVADTFGGD